MEVFAQGIQVYTDSGGYFEAVEVDLILLLQLIDNGVRIFSM